ncbi:Polyprenyl synthetase [Streptomyces iranensis]|uniref:Polyprenyl synthetase n=1 Tax=Streptomyces iranensis TaxID=576784 RepID=A0A061A3Y5_9ACTN|nr:Polyprenyl synthetase [Streptomyces iranensis]
MEGDGETPLPDDTSWGASQAIPALADLRACIDAVLTEFLREKAAAAEREHLPASFVQAVAGFLAAGGKRLRPLLCVTGWHAAVGERTPPAAVIRVAAALEMFHAFALIHDDVMDQSSIRRGEPTVHRALAGQRIASGDSPESAEWFGVGAAVLVGDLALTWSDELIHTAGLTPDELTGLLPLLDVMRSEIMYGQYLDLAATGSPTDDVERALTIARYKTSKYSIERPLHIGAVLAGADDDLLDALTAYALPLGEAFQLRDDLLGAFGDPAETGKPRMDDLRDGKHTALVALALRTASADSADLLRDLLGRADLTDAQAERVRAVLIESGARTGIEDMIAQHRDSVEKLLSNPGSIHPGALPVLRCLAESATQRSV